MLDGLRVSLVIHAALMALAVSGAFVATTLDLRFGTTNSEPIPVTVRDNPGSWRPTYVGSSGWRAPVTSGGGGFSFGK